MSDYYDDFDDWDDGDIDLEDSFESALQNCGMLSDGVCMFIGSEYCDWECPVRHWDSTEDESEAP